MTEEKIIDKEDKTKKHRNNEIDCLHFGCRKGKSGNVLFWCHFYDDHCDNYTGCYYRKYLRLEQENKKLKEKVKALDKMTGIFSARLCDKYRSALEEIREIVNQPCNNCKYNKDDITCSIGDCGEGKLKIIETKINEVLK